MYASVATEARTLREVQKEEDFIVTMCGGLVPAGVWDHAAAAPPPQREWNTKPRDWDKERFNTTEQ